MRTLICAIPSTYTGDEKRADLRTYKIGVLARVFATFGVTDVCVYYDPDPHFDSHGLGRFIVKVLKYLNTPPYLRKVAFPLDKSLRYIGLCEPLKTPHHLKREPWRYVYVLEDLGDKLRVSDGKDEFIVKKGKGVRRGERILVIDVKRKITVDKHELDVYWGYDVFYFNRTLDVLLERLKERGFLIIGTSKYGEDVRKARISKRDKIAIIFGGPFRGIREILKKKWHTHKKYFDYFLNFIPRQNVETIRMKEAVHYVLAVLRYLSVI